MDYEIKQITGELFYGICRRCKLIVTGRYRDVKKRMMLHSCEEVDSDENKIKRKTFQSDLISYIEYEVSILDETVIITQRSNLSNEFKSIEISRTVFEEIIGFYNRAKEVDFDG